MTAIEVAAIAARHRYHASVMTRRARFLLPLAGVAAFASGCSSGGNRIAAENDRLRAQAVDLEQQVRALTGRIAELESQLSLAAKEAGTVSEEVVAATPRLVTISIGRLSHAGDDNADGAFDRLTVYLEPEDGLGRFMQVVGTVSMHAAVLPAEGPALTIGQATIGPKALREAYRSAFGGPSYTLTLPINPPAEAVQCTVRVVFKDAYTGHEFSAERGIELR
jgi:hypothetical protein